MPKNSFVSKALQNAIKGLIKGVTYIAVKLLLLILAGICKTIKNRTKLMTGKSL